VADFFNKTHLIFFILKAKFLENIGFYEIIYF